MGWISSFKEKKNVGVAMNAEEQSRFITDFAMFVAKNIAIENIRQYYE